MPGELKKSYEIFFEELMDFAKDNCEDLVFKQSIDLDFLKDNSEVKLKRNLSEYDVIIFHFETCEYEDYYNLVECVRRFFLYFGASNIANYECSWFNQVISVFLE